MHYDETKVYFWFGIVLMTTVVRHSGSEDSDRRQDGGSVGGMTHLNDFDDDNHRPIFKLSPQNVTVSPGGRASLKCKVDNLGTKTVIWRKQNEASPLTIGNYPFAADARISVDVNLRAGEWILMIQDVKTSDEGLYICQVSTKDASEHMFTVQLNVKTIQVSAVSGTNHVESGSTIRLVCTATGRPEPPHNVDWLKNGQTIVSDVQRGLIISKKIETKLLISELTIPSARQSDVGDYVCLSSDNESASISVIVAPVPSMGKRGATGNNKEPISFYRSSANTARRRSSNIWRLRLSGDSLLTAGVVAVTMATFGAPT